MMAHYDSAAPLRNGTRGGRRYEADELALFAEYSARRQPLQPAECTGAGRCWVKCGPPGYEGRGAGKGRCRECGGSLP